VLRVLRRYKPKYGFLAYMTCHDFYLVYYNAALMHYVDGKSKLLDLNILRVGPPPHIRFRGVGIFKMVSSDHRCILHLFPAPIRRGLASVATGASHERAA
jgi:hypothetical protein